MSEEGPSRTQSEVESERAASRERSYGLLAWLFLEGLDIAFLEQLLDADMRSTAALLAAGGDAEPRIRAGLEEMRSWLTAQSDRSLEQIHQDLVVEGTRLFRGIAPGYGPPPPYEALHHRSRIGKDAETLLRIREFYREAAADLPSTSHERIDHLGMELAFMRFLCGEETRSRLANDADGAMRIRRIERRFLAEHLMAWVPEYCQRILEEPCAEFFHGLLHVLSAFLAGDADLLERADGQDAGRDAGPASVR